MKKSKSLLVIISFLFSLFGLITKDSICAQPEVDSANSSVSFTNFSESLKNALAMPPGNAKITKYKQLRAQAIELQQQEMFVDSLQKWVESRVASELKQLSEFLNYTAYNNDFASFRDRLIKLSSMARQPISYKEKISRLNTKIERATVSQARKTSFLQIKNEYLRKMEMLFLERGGKSAEELDRLQELFSNAVSSGLFVDFKDIEKLQFWSKNALVVPSISQDLAYLWQRVKSGWAIENRDSFFGSVSSLMQKIYKAYIEKKLDVDIKNVKRLLNAIRYGDGFTGEQKKKSIAWLEEIDEQVHPSASVGKLTYDQHLNIVIKTILDPMTFSNEGSRKYFFGYLKELVNNRIYADTKELSKLATIINFVKWNDLLLPHEKTEINGLLISIKTAGSYVEQVNSLIQDLSNVAQDPGMKLEFLNKVNVLVNRFVSEKAAGKKPSGQAEIAKLLNLIKISPLFMDDKDSMNKVSKMVAALTGAKPGKTPEQIEKEKAEQIKKQEEEKTRRRSGGRLR